MSVGIQGPTAGVIVGPAILAGIVGGSGALSDLLALVAMSFVAYAFVLFSRSFNSSSSVYASNGSTLGSRYGFVSVWLLLLVYVSFAGAVYGSTAHIGGALLSSPGIQMWWVWLALIGWALTMLFAYLSLGLSSVVILVCERAAVALITVVGIAVLAHGGAHHRHPFSAAPFATHGIAFSVLGLGVVNAFGGFSGFEGAATLGEESARAERTIADVYVGSGMGKLVNVAGVISAFGAQLACINAANRLLFALGRERGGTRRAGELLVYLLTVIAALVLTWRRGRRPLPLAILAVGGLVLGYVLHVTFTPLPGGPFRWVAVAAVISLPAGIGISLVPSVHRRLRVSPLLRATAAEPSVGVAGPRGPEVL